VFFFAYPGYDNARVIFANPNRKSFETLKAMADAFALCEFLASEKSLCVAP
jgi:hypothetical protein